MQGDAEQPLACALGVTGKMIRKALVVRPAPGGFRESLLRNLVEGRIDPAILERSSAGRTRRNAGRPPLG